MDDAKAAAMQALQDEMTAEIEEMIKRDPRLEREADLDDFAVAVLDASAKAEYGATSHDVVQRAYTSYTKSANLRGGLSQTAAHLRDQSWRNK